MTDPITTQEPVGAVGRDFWKGIANDISGAESADDVFRLSPDLDFTVIKAPLQAMVTLPVRASVEQALQASIGVIDAPEVVDLNGQAVTYERGSVEVPGHMATIRTDTNAVLGVVSDQWQTYQNRELTDFAEALRGEVDAPYLRSINLFGGRVIGLELALGPDSFVPGDPSPYGNRAFIWTGHDGRHALNIQRIKVRWFCANQFTTVTSGAIATFKVRHTKNMGVNVKEVLGALNMVAQYDQSFEEAMVALTKRTFTTAMTQQFAADLLPIPKDTKNPIRTLNARDNIVDLFTSSPTLLDVPLTAYRAFQATGEHIDHFRTYRASKGGTATDGRALSLLEGPAQALKVRALTLLSA